MHKVHLLLGIYQRPLLRHRYLRIDSECRLNCFSDLKHSDQVWSAHLDVFSAGCLPTIFTPQSLSFFFFFRKTGLRPQILKMLFF